ncbi:28S ribosomal protein S5, mitochondrial [Ptychographa xylographoides]|nr:28S ribosomal protein S5, mitochondrial [Ptychographa xylographoides]
MSRSQSLRCVFTDSSKCLQLSTTPRSGPPAITYLHNTRKRRHFHTSPSHASRPSPKFPNVKASSLGLTNSDSTKPQVRQSTLANYAPFTPAALAQLKKTTTPAQFAAIEAGESSIAPEDLLNQAVIRQDPMAIPYLDDFSEIRAVIDNPVRNSEKNYDPNLRFKTEDEILSDMGKFVEGLSDDPNASIENEWLKFEEKTRLMVGMEDAELKSRSYEAPEIPELTDPMTRAAVNAGQGYGDEGANDDQHMQRLMKQTGMDPRTIRRFRSKVLVQHRVVNQTRMGKVASMYYLSVAGNGSGMVGIGEGKSTEPEDAKRQSEMNAVKNLMPIVRYEDRTIFGDVKGKVGATELTLMTRPPGFGIRCQHLIYEICKCAGIEDLAARVTRARNPMNTVKATMQALLSQRLPEEVARARGKKLVDVRKVYYGGNV